MEIAEENEALIRRFYDELWNGWRFDLIDEMLAADDRVVTRMTWSGTHRGALGGVEPTDAHVEYAARPSFGWARV